MLLLLALALAQDLDAVLRDLRDERADVRDRASAALAAGWERWTEAELARIEELRKGLDAELAGRASDALGTIRLRRSIGKELLGRFPDLERIVRSGTTEERREVLLSLRRSWRLLEVETERLRGLVDAMIAHGFEMEEKDALLSDFIPPFRPLLRPWLRRPELRWSAVDLIDDHGAREYVPELRALLRDSDVRVRFGAASTLAGFGMNDGIEVALAALDSPDEAIAARTPGLLVHLDARAHAARLLPYLKNATNAKVRENAAWALGRLRVQEAEPALAALIDDPEPQVRMSVYEALADLDAKRRAPAILERIRGTHGQEFDEIQHALIRLGLEPLRDRLEALCADPEDLVRAVAWELMTRLDPDRPLKFLGHPDPKVREWAAWALVDLHRPSDADRLVALLGDPSTDVRRAALWGLGSTAGPRHVDAIVGRLVDGEGAVRYAAVQTLSSLQARDRADAVAERLKDVDEWTATETLDALGELGARKHADAIAARLSSDRDARAALAGLAGLGLRDRRADFEAALKHEDSDVRSRAVRALDELDLGTVKELAPLLDDRDGQGVAEPAVRALAWIGSDEALRLVREYGKKDPLHAAYALLEYGPAGDVSSVVEALADPDVHHRRFACEALARWTARGLAVADLDRLTRLLDRVEESSDQIGKATLRMTRVGLGLRDPKTLSSDSIGWVDESVSFRVLCRAFAPDATAKMHRPFVPEKDIDSTASMSAVLEKAWGVKVEIDPSYYFPGIHPAGARTTGMRLIDRLVRRYRIRHAYIPTTGLMADGDAFRVVPEEDARAFWRGKLGAMK